MKTTRNVFKMKLTNWNNNSTKVVVRIQSVLLKVSNVWDNGLGLILK